MVTAPGRPGEQNPAYSPLSTHPGRFRIRIGLCELLRVRHPDTVGTGGPRWRTLTPDLRFGAAVDFRVHAPASAHECRKGHVPHAAGTDRRTWASPVRDRALHPPGPA